MWSSDFAVHLAQAKWDEASAARNAVLVPPNASLTGAALLRPALKARS